MFLQSALALTGKKFINYVSNTRPLFAILVDEAAAENLRKLAPEEVEILSGGART